MAFVYENPFELTCKRCGHYWIKTITGIPKICPCCKSHLWDISKAEHVKMKQKLLKKKLKPREVLVVLNAKRRRMKVKG